MSFYIICGPPLDKEARTSLYLLINIMFIISFFLSVPFKLFSSVISFGKHLMGLFNTTNISTTFTKN